MENLIVTIFGFLLALLVKLMEQVIVNQEKLKDLEKRLELLEKRRNWL